MAPQKNTSSVPSVTRVAICKYAIAKDMVGRYPCKSNEKEERRLTLSAFRSYKKWYKKQKQHSTDEDLDKAAWGAFRDSVLERGGEAEDESGENEEADGDEKEANGDEKEADGEEKEADGEEADDEKEEDGEESKKESKDRSKAEDGDEKVSSRPVAITPVSASLVDELVQRIGKLEVLHELSREAHNKLKFLTTRTIRSLVQEIDAIQRPQMYTEDAYDLDAKPGDSDVVPQFTDSFHYYDDDDDERDCKDIDSDSIELSDWNEMKGIRPMWFHYKCGEVDKRLVGHSAFVPFSIIACLLMASDRNRQPPEEEEVEAFIDDTDEFCAAKGHERWNSLYGVNRAEYWIRVWQRLSLRRATVSVCMEMPEHPSGVSILRIEPWGSDTAIEIPEFLLFVDRKNFATIVFPNQGEERIQTHIAWNWLREHGDGAHSTYASKRKPDEEPSSPAPSKRHKPESQPPEPTEQTCRSTETPSQPSPPQPPTESPPPPAEPLPPADSLLPPSQPAELPSLPPPSQPAELPSLPPPSQPAEPPSQPAELPSLPPPSQPAEHPSQPAELPTQLLSPPSQRNQTLPKPPLSPGQLRSNLTRRTFEKEFGDHDFDRVNGSFAESLARQKKDEAEELAKKQAVPPSQPTKQPRKLTKSAKSAKPSPTPPPQQATELAQDTPSSMDVDVPKTVFAPCVPETSSHDRKFLSKFTHVDRLIKKGRYWTMYQVRGPPARYKLPNDRSYALKLFDETHTAMCKKEDEASRVYRGVWTRQQYGNALLQDYLPFSLKRILTSPLECEAAVEVLDNVAYTVRVAHDKKFLHTSIKPSNLLGGSSATAELQLSNWGNDGTDTGTRINEPFYRPPESLTDAVATDKWDVWSMGCVFYECLSGTPLFATADELKGFDPAQLIKRLPETPQAIVTFLSTVLSLDPNARPTAREVVDKMLPDCRRALAAATPDDDEGSEYTKES